MPTTESTELLASSVARSDAQALTASGTSFSTPALSRGLRPRWLRLGSESLGPILVMRPLQRSQAYVGEQSSRNSMRSKALAPPSGTEEYLLGAVPTHVQTTFLRGGRAAELYLALTNRSLRMRLSFGFVAPRTARRPLKTCCTHARQAAALALQGIGRLTAGLHGIGAYLSMSSSFVGSFESPKNGPSNDVDDVLAASRRA